MGLHQKKFYKNKLKKVWRIFVTVIVVTALVIIIYREKNVAGIAGVAVITSAGIYLYYRRKQKKSIVPLPVLYRVEENSPTKQGGLDNETK